MVAIVESERRVLMNGDIKIIMIQTTAACDSSHTLDLGSDAANGTGVVIEEIYNTLIQDDLGADVESRFDPDTGIITMSTITTGIHNLLVVGR